MEFSFWKSLDRDRVCLIEHDGTEHQVGRLIDAGNQVAHQLAARGIGPGDVVAMCLHNEVAVYELYLAIMQMGVYLVPINWHSTANEAAYILENSEAKAVFCSPQFADMVGQDGLAHRFCTGDLEGFEHFDVLKTGPTDPPATRLAGGIMNYTSGTTGQPKGVKRPLPPCPPEPITTAYASFLLMFGMSPGTGVQLVGSPLYHTAVLYFSTSALHLGHTVVLMKKWTPAGMLERIERHRVTCSHMVPTQFSRMLALPNHRDYDCSSVTHMVHGAAPCPNHVKEQMLAWWGDTVYEYYAATEGGGTMVTPQEWRERPGTVGQAWATAEIAIFDDDGNRLGADDIGTVYIKMQQSFEYYRDKAKTEKSYNTDGYFTVGDAGYLDSEGYLFLCDRKADMIISGGVNIYPAEIEGVMAAHANVVDVAVFGIPDDDWGEQVRAVVELKEPSADDAESIRVWCLERIAKFKCPKTVEVIDEMPRDLNGKLRKRKLRDPFWEAHQAATGRQI
jgi:long-chain acyl-CoA synthetase